jgi:hypothetical protein
VHRWQLQGDRLITGNADRVTAVTWTDNAFTARCCLLLLLLLLLQVCQAFLVRPHQAHQLDAALVHTCSYPDKHAAKSPAGI